MLAAAEAQAVTVNSEINLLFEFILCPLIKVMDVKVVKEPVCTLLSRTWKFTTQMKKKRLKDSSRIGGGGREKEIGELSEDVSAQSAAGGSLLTGGSEAVSTSRHSAPSVGACSPSRGGHAVCRLWSGLCSVTEGKRDKGHI